MEAPGEVSVRLTLTSSEILAIRKCGGRLRSKLDLAIHEANMPSIVKTRLGWYVVRDPARIYGRFRGPTAYTQALRRLEDVNAWLDQAPGGES